MALLDYFKKRGAIVKELNNLRNRMAIIKLVLTQPDRCQFYINDNGVLVDVKRMYRLHEGSVVDVLIKRFPYGDDPEYARLCAKELLDELNKEI